MSDYAQIIELPAYKLGDRWPASPNGDAKITFGPITFTVPDGDPVPPEHPLARFVMRFRNKYQTFVVDSDAGADATAAIVDAALWRVEVPTIQQFLPSVGPWEWDAAYYDAVNDSPITLHKGVITPIQDVE